MKTRLRLILCAILSVSIALIMVGCDDYQVPSTQQETPNNLINSLDIRVDGAKLEYDHQLDNGITVATRYNMGQYDIDRWLITDSKTMDFRLQVINAPEGTEIFVEHVHIDVSVAATAERVNGLMQDSMDDTFHANGVTQPGWYVSPEYIYEETFAIEGYSETLLSGWGWYIDGLGFSSASEKRLTESKLLYYGAYGSKIQVVYNLAIRYPGEQYYHSKTITDQMIFLSTQKLEGEPISENTTELEVVNRIKEAQDAGLTEWTAVTERHITFLQDNKKRFEDIGYVVDGATIRFPSSE